ncbi:protein-export chaperone SecB [Pseudomonas lopnurensis]|uniref:protein-export chaperone SecB n=1 Tax=Pseudomonas lopnurensis TaxID=1477517 RepID=UPI0018798249|nr:protein-export chaperone SecB [Pseudomonas lopnurensis]MBE7373031.1 protein-export chaperone SecB [Pseudomonas lopnurensis]
MKRSPLQVKHYHFSHLALTARPDFDIERLAGSEPYPSFAGTELKHDVTLAEPADEDDPTQFAVILSVQCEPEEGSPFPYSFAAEMEGIFEIEDEGPLEARKRLVVVNGASVLLGALREQLLALSARHKYGPFLLPCLDFRTLVAKPEAAAPEDA